MTSSQTEEALKLVDPTKEEARRLVDVFLRPFHTQPFNISTEVEEEGTYMKVSFTYGSENTAGYAWVDVETKEVRTQVPEQT